MQRNAYDKLNAYERGDADVERDWNNGNAAGKYVCRGENWEA